MRLWRSRRLPLDRASLRDQDLALHAECGWDRAVTLGEKHGFRNAQTSVVAPTGTIGLVMDCDTTGIEPDFALVKFKKLAGGGYSRSSTAPCPKLCAPSAMANRISPRSKPMRSAMPRSARRPRSTTRASSARGFSDEKLAELEKTLASAFDIKFVFNKWTLGADFLVKQLGVPEEKLDDPSFDLLSFLGFSKQDIEAANVHGLRRHDA